MLCYLVTITTLFLFTARCCPRQAFASDCGRWAQEIYILIQFAAGGALSSHASQKIYKPWQGLYPPGVLGRFQKRREEVRRREGRRRGHRRVDRGVGRAGRRGDGVLPREQARVEPLEHGDGQGLRADVGPQGAARGAWRLVHAVDAPLSVRLTAAPAAPPLPLRPPPSTTHEAL